MRFSSLLYILVLMTFCITTDAVKKKLIDVITVCKRNDPEISKCMCTNMNKVIPRLKDGIPEMNIIPIDPILVENVRIDLPQTPSMKAIADLLNATISGLSKAEAYDCHAWKTPIGVDMSVNFHFPEFALKSLYKVVGNFLLFQINAVGDFHGEFNEIRLQTRWNTTSYTKNKKEYLHISGDVVNMTMEKLAIHFNHLFGNRTELNESMNTAINDNIDMLYDEMKPVILKTVREITLSILKDFYKVFPFNVLFPE